VSAEFGRRLRHERERRRIDLGAIAETSKISASLFEDLERGDASRWPSGIFRRAFIRAYAQAVGIDPEATTKEFLELFPDPNDPDPSALAPAQSAAAPAAPPTLRLTLADTGHFFVRGRALRSLHNRLAAAACDALFVTVLGLVVYAVLGVWWMPLCLVLVGYYAGSVLLLGNTPGVCLCAPGRAPALPPALTSRTSLLQRLRSSSAGTRLLNSLSRT
jgi:transcriptional regulator with XRE-family HTH domain